MQATTTTTNTTAAAGRRHSWQPTSSLLHHHPSTCSSRHAAGPPASSLPRLHPSTCSSRHHAAGRCRLRAATPAAAAQTPQTSGFSVVITGGSKGLGFCMAAEFLKAGDSVVICGRDPRRLAGALAALQQVAEDSSPARPRPRVSGLTCDVSKAAEVDALERFVADAFDGRPPDIWLNNAGQVTPRRVLTDIEPGVLESVVGVNVLGSLLCCRAAIALARQQRQQQQQQAAGGQQARTTHIYNCGFSWGAGATKSACTHKATKAALSQLNSALSDDLREAGIDYVQVHNLSPGMVLTDLLLANAPLAARRIFNVLADEPEDVAAAVVPRIRAAAASNARGPAGDVSHLSPASAASRMLRGLPQVISGSGRFFTATGERAQPGRFNAAGVRLLHDAQE